MVYEKILGWRIFEQIGILFTKKCFLGSLVEISSSREDKKYGKSLQYDNTNDDSETQRAYFDQKCPHEPLEPLFWSTFQVSGANSDSFIMSHMYECMLTAAEI